MMTGSYEGNTSYLWHSKRLESLFAGNVQTNRHGTQLINEIVLVSGLEVIVYARIRGAVCTAVSAVFRFPQVHHSVVGSRIIR